MRWTATGFYLRTAMRYGKAIFVLANWAIIGALATIGAAVLTGTIALLSLVLSSNPEWIADRKLLKRLGKKGRIKDVCLSICLSRCSILIIESDMGHGIIVQNKVGKMGLVRKTHLFVTPSYQPEIEELVSSGLLRRLEDSVVSSYSSQAYAGYQITGEWIRLSEKIEDRLVRYRVGESLFSHEGTFTDLYAWKKVTSLRKEEILCEFPGIELRNDWDGRVPVRFVPILQARNNEFATAFFSGHECGFVEGRVLTFQPMTRPVNLGESQFDNLQGRLTASIVSVKEGIDRDGRPITSVGLCYTGQVLNAL